MERCILENRQLIPPISDQHLIRKLARHYHHEIAVATVTRGVKNIAEFQVLLTEFTAMRKVNNDRAYSQVDPDQVKREQKERTNRPWQNKSIETPAEYH